MLDLKAFKTARFSTGFSFPWFIKYIIFSHAPRDQLRTTQIKSLPTIEINERDLFLHKQQFYEIMEFTAFNESAIVFQKDLSLCAFMN